MSAKEENGVERVLFHGLPLLFVLKILRRTIRHLLFDKMDELSLVHPVAGEVFCFRWEPMLLQKPAIVGKVSSSLAVN